MVRHIVFWNLLDEAMGGDKNSNAAKIKVGLESLVGVIDGLLEASVSMNFNPNGYDLCLYSIFRDKESLDFYQSHPEHQKVRDLVHKVTCARAVTDCEV